jgi:hypothetical protein
MIIQRTAQPKNSKYETYFSLGNRRITSKAGLF